MVNHLFYILQSGTSKADIYVHFWIGKDCSAVSDTSVQAQTQKAPPPQMNRKTNGIIRKCSRAFQ
jgi:hypothetical protein